MYGIRDVDKYAPGRGVMRLSSWYVEGTSTTLALSATDGCTYERHFGLHKDAAARVAFVRDTLANILWRKAKSCWLYK